MTQRRVPNESSGGGPTIGYRSITPSSIYLNLEPIGGTTKGTYTGITLTDGTSTSSLTVYGTSNSRVTFPQMSIENTLGSPVFFNDHPGRVTPAQYGQIRNVAFEHYISIIGGEIPTYTFGFQVPPADTNEIIDTVSPSGSIFVEGSVYEREARLCFKNRPAASRIRVQVDDTDPFTRRVDKVGTFVNFEKMVVNPEIAIDTILNTSSFIAACGLGFRSFTVGDEV